MMLNRNKDAPEQTISIWQTGRGNSDSENTLNES